MSSATSARRARPRAVRYGGPLANKQLIVNDKLRGSESYPNNAPCSATQKTYSRIGLIQVVKEFGSRINACYQQLISRSRAGHVQQVPLRIVDFFQVSIIGD